MLIGKIKLVGGFFFFNCVEKDGFFFFLQSNTSVCPKIPTLPRHPSAPIMSDIG